MKTSIRSFVLLFALLVQSLAGAAEPLVVAVNQEDKPFCWVNEQGRLTGFSVDIARAMCLAMKRECRIVPAPFAQFIAGVAEKKFDFVVANVLRTPEREKLVDFSERFWRSTSTFVGRPGVLREVAPANLKGRKIGVQKGSVQERYLREFAAAAQIESYPTNTERNAALVGGKVELIMASTISNFTFLSSEQGGQFDFVGAPLSDHGLGGDVAIPVAKGRNELREAINAAIRQVLHDGTYARINNQYFPASVF